MSLNTLRDAIHDNAVAKGWHPEGPQSERFPTLLCLVHAEVSEALEDYRLGYTMTAQWRTPNPHSTAEGKPEGIPSELADIIIRVLDICGLYGIDIESAVKAKMAYNQTRPHRHGGKVC